MSSLGQTVAVNTAAQIGGKMVATGLGVIATLLLTRYLGPEGYGTYTLVLVLVTLFGSLSDWGLSLITIREASKNQERAAEIVGNVLVIRLLLALAAMAASVVLVHLVPRYADIRSLVIIASFFLLALSVKTSFQIIFNVKLQMQNWAITEVSGNVALVLLLVYLITKNAGLPEIFLAINVAHFVAAGLAALLARRLLAVKLSLKIKETKHLLLEVLPMGTILVVFTVYNRLDTIILSFFSGQQAVGIYGLAYRIYEVLVLGAAYFANSILPRLSVLANEDREKFGRLYNQSIVVLFGLGLTVAAFNFIAAPIMVAVLGGSEYRESVVPVRLLSLALVVSYFNHLNGYSLIALGKQWWSLGIAVAALVINVFLNLVFIPAFSYRAAAVNTFLTEGFIVLVSFWLIRRSVGGLSFNTREILDLTKEGIAIVRGQLSPLTKRR